jgi:hypothetical protein
LEKLYLSTTAFWRKVSFELGMTACSILFWKLNCLLSDKR